MTGYEALREAAAWIDLSARGKIRVTGEDRARLLHAMSTNHVQGLGVGEGLYAFFLTAQGRILGDACIYNPGDSLLLDTEPETGAKLAAHLDKFIIADDAEIADETSAWAVIGIEGPHSLECAAKLSLPVPEAQSALLPWNDGFVTRIASTGPAGIRVFLPIGEKDGFTASLDIPFADADAARAVRLENGLPRYGEDISERFLVQESHQLHAVHTSKGCYLGQEIVERVRSRGQVHRLLTPIRIQTPEPPPAGAKIATESGDVAEITSAIYSPALRLSVGLAYIRTEALHNPPPLFLAGSDPRISVTLA